MTKVDATKSESVAKPCTSALGRQWSRKRVTKQNNSQDEAAAKVSALIVHKQAYYSELLEMRRLELQRKMEMLSTKQQYYTAKLQRLMEE